MSNVIFKWAKAQKGQFTEEKVLAFKYGKLFNLIHSKRTIKESCKKILYSQMRLMQIKRCV